MTGPWTDWTGQFGINSPLYQSEYAAARAEREAVMNRVGQQFGMQPVPQGQPQRPAGPGWTDEDLVGAGVYWGLPEEAVRAMPRQAVIDFVNQHRAASRQAGLSEMASEFAPLAMFGVGAGEAITGGLMRVPLLGAWLSEGGLVKSADLKLRQLEEGIRASTGEDMQRELSVANIAGNLAATLYPGAVAWSVAGNIGKVMPLVSKASPIGRAAFQGGLSSYLLAGGTNEQTENPWMHRAMVVGAGAGLGAVFGALEKPIGDAVARVTRSFVSSGLTKPTAGPVQLGPSQVVAGSQELGPIQAVAGAQQLGPDAPHMIQLQQLAASGDEQAIAMLQYLKGGGPPEPPAGGGMGGAISPEAPFVPPPGMPPEVALQIQRQPDFSPQVGRASAPDFGPQVGLAPDISPFAPAPGGSPAGTPFENWSPQVGLMGSADNLPRFGADATNQAEALAVQMNKAATVVASPDFPAMSGQTMLDDVAVGRAAVAENPGGTNVVQGVGDPGAFVQGLGTNVAFARRGQRLDALVSDGPLSSKAVGEYETFGMYTGQRVLTSDGIGATIEGIGLDGEVLLSPIYAGTPMRRPIGDLHPMVSSPGKVEVPQLWDMFSMYAEQQAIRTQAAMGGALGPDQLGTVKQQNMAQWMEDFLDNVGIVQAGDRSRVREYFNLRYVDEFKSLAPQEIAFGQAATAAENAEIARTVLPAVQQLDQSAATKGFRVIPVDEGKWIVEDMLPSNKMPPVPEGHTRLYRGETGNPQGAGVPEWMQQDPRYLATKQATGRWFSDNMEAASYYARVHGEDATNISYIDVPTSSLEQFRASAQPDAARFSAAGRATEEYFVGAAEAAARKPVTITSGTSRMTFETREAAETYLRQFDRSGSMPDITPESPVPLELVPRHPTESPQAPNLNEQTLTQTAASIAELDAPVPGGPGLGAVSGGGGDLPPTAQLVAEGRHGQLNNRWIQKFLRWQPARRLVSRLDEGIKEHTGTDFGIAPMWENMATRLNQHHTMQNPLFDELSDIFSRVTNTKLLTDGTWTRTYEILDPARRVQVARAAGMTDREIATFDEFGALMRKMFQTTGLDADRELRQYISHIAQRQSRRETVGRAWDDFPLTESTTPFYEHARTGNLNFREMDPRKLGEVYIRAVTWKKNMAQPWDEAVAKLDLMKQQGMELFERTGGATNGGDDSILQVAHIMDQQLKLMKFGYQAEDDIALDTAHGALQILLGEQVTREQARQLFGMGMNSIHASMLGFRPSVIARDLLQVFLAVPRAGQELLGVYSKWMRDPVFRQTAWKAALDEGAVTLQMPRMASPSSLGGELQAQAAFPSALGEGDASLRMRGVAKIATAVREHVPEWLRDTRDSWLSPMYLYGKQAEMTRAMVYTAGKEKATAAIAKFRADGSRDMATLMGESSARTYDPAWQREFQKLVSAGADQDAAKFLGRQLAQATQFDYGVVHSPWAAKSMTGRVAMQFGNYPMQYFQFLRESLKNGTNGDRVKLIGLAAATFGALGYGSRKTGWNFRWMNPFSGFGFTGGPMINIAADIGQGARQAINTVTNPDNASLGLINQGVNAGMDALGYLNPARGLWATAQGIGQAMDSPMPVAAIARHFITGQTGAGPDINNTLLPQAEASFQRSLQPVQTPNRATGIGLPPGQFPQQPVTLPPTMQDPRQIPGRSQAPDTSAIPFGPPTPGASSVYGYQDVVGALRGDSTFRRFMTADELQVLDSLRGIPVEIAMEQFRGYMNQKVARQGAGVAPGGIRP